MIPIASEPNPSDQDDPNDLDPNEFDQLDELNETEELAPQPPVRSEFAKAAPSLSYTVRRIITVFVLMAIIGGAIYFVVNRWHPASSGEIPTIAAATDVKQKPQQPGGIDIPHQDVQVYKELDAGNAAKPPQVEHLLPPPETPAAAPPAAPKPAAITPAVPQMESLLPPPKVETTAIQTPIMTTSSPISSGVVPAPAPAPIAVAPKPVASVTKAPAITVASLPPPVAVAPAPSPAPAIKKAAVTSVPVVNTVKAPVASGKKNVAVQLASTPDPDNARHIVEELQKKYAGDLNGTKLHVVKANLGARGTFYRIESPLMTKEQAEGICTDLKKQKAGCLLVHP